jgi:hypothetical protein
VADEGRRWALYDHPRRMEFMGRALAEMLGERGGTGRTATPDPDEMEVRVVALMMAEPRRPALSCPTPTSALGRNRS